MEPGYYVHNGHPVHLIFLLGVLNDFHLWWVDPLNGEPETFELFEPGDPVSPLLVGDETSNLWSALAVSAL